MNYSMSGISGIACLDVSLACMPVVMTVAPQSRQVQELTLQCESYMVAVGGQTGSQHEHKLLRDLRGYLCFLQGLCVTS